jgi:hypothetical protein
MKRRARSWLEHPALPLALIAALHPGCVGGYDDDAFLDGPYTDHEEDSDYDEPTVKAAVEGLSLTFQQNNVMSDEFFNDSDMLDGDAVQAFLEDTPYSSGRCWLADYRIDGERAADVIVRASQEQGVNPVVMLARMQVEKSLISKSSRPSQSGIDWAFGCGCPDGAACNPAYQGLERQIACAARTLRRNYDRSVDGTGAWRRGVRKNTLDGIRITPENHATATHYAYTPWVLRNTGGNWLVWSVLLKFANQLVTLGLIESTPEACTVDGAAGQCVDTSLCDAATHVSTAGRCAGPSNIQCCTPRAAEEDVESCTVGGVVGQCIDTSRCYLGTHASTSGYCPGPSNIRCCTPLPAEDIQTCTVGTVEGQCIDTSRCPASTHVATPGHCPGPSNIQCCTLRPPPPPFEWEEEPGGDEAPETPGGDDGAEDATSLIALAGTTTAIDETGADLYTLELGAGDRVSITIWFEGVDLDLDLDVEHPDGQVTSGFASDPDRETVGFTASTTGEYLVQVYPFTGEGTYTIDLSIEP